MGRIMARRRIGILCISVSSRSTVQALLITEATAVSLKARITPDCLGLYKDEHEAAFKRIVKFCKRHSKIALGIQLSHSGRKGSTPTARNAPLTPEDDAWQTLSSAGIPRADGNDGSGFSEIMFNLQFGQTAPALI